MLSIPLASSRPPRLGRSLDPIVRLVRRLPLRGDSERARSTGAEPRPMPCGFRLRRPRRTAGRGRSSPCRLPRAGMLAACKGGENRARSVRLQIVETGKCGSADDQRPRAERGGAAARRSVAGYGAAAYKAHRLFSPAMIPDQAARSAVLGFGADIAVQAHSPKKLLAELTFPNDALKNLGGTLHPILRVITDSLEQPDHFAWFEIFLSMGVDRRQNERLTDAESMS